MANIAVILSGSGYLDGAEIRESVLSLLYLDEFGADVTIFAPDQPQHHTINHYTQDESTEERNILHEAARIARGNVKPLGQLKVDAFDALIIPGGFGVAKNLSDIAFKGAACQLNETFSGIICAFYNQEKPIGAICIAPVAVAKALEGSGVALTIGDDADTISVIESLGCQHIVAQSDECVVDEAHKIVTCSAYMRDDALSPIAKGIKKTIESVLEMTKNNT